MVHDVLDELVSNHVDELTRSRDAGFFVYVGSPHHKRAPNLPLPSIKKWCRCVQLVSEKKRGGRVTE